jgi:hypothetical protein
MFDHNKVAAALERKREKFSSFSQMFTEEQERIEEAFAQFQQMSSQRLWQQLNELDDPWPGALPTPEWDQADGLRLAFKEAWANHRDARQWALAILYERPSLAVDGSQITPTKDFSVPVGAVQIGWFVNEHRQSLGNGLGNGASSYVKDIHFEVLPPDELGDEEDEDGGDFPNWRVNQRRFVLECEKLCELMEEYAERPPEYRPLCFFDGSLVISFAGQLRPERARPYLRAVEEVLACSERYQTPVVGFVDSTYSQDLVTLINRVVPGKPIRQTSDARLLQSLLPEWGDRSPVFVCARPDQLSTNGRADFYKQVCFTYVRLVGERPPARLELPRWLVEMGEAEAIINRVRAECVVGTGYPYPIETADAVAVISQQDRERFYRLFQQFLESEGISLSTARKMRSKRVRR